MYGTVANAPCDLFVYELCYRLLTGTSKILKNIEVECKDVCII